MNRRCGMPPDSQAFHSCLQKVRCANEIVMLHSKCFQSWFPEAVCGKTQQCSWLWFPRRTPGQFQADREQIQNPEFFPDRMYESVQLGTPTAPSDSQKTGWEMSCSLGIHLFQETETTKVGGPSKSTILKPPQAASDSDSEQVGLIE